MNTIWIVLPILTVLMFDLGLCLKLQDFARVVKAPKAVLALKDMPVLHTRVCDKDKMGEAVLAGFGN